jgi:SEC-C motif domain protein
MRSRYSAYARLLVDYIVDTTDPDGDAWQEPVEEWRREIRQFSKETDFQGVEIIDAEVHGETGTVTFLARLQRRGEDASFTEISQFTRRDGRWLYSAGEPG